MAETTSTTKTTRARRTTTASKKTEDSTPKASTAKPPEGAERKTKAARSVLPKVEGKQWTLGKSVLGGYTLELHDPGKSGTGIISAVRKDQGDKYDALEKAAAECMHVLQFNKDMDEELAKVKHLEALEV